MFQTIFILCWDVQKFIDSWYYKTCTCVCYWYRHCRPWIMSTNNGLPLFIDMYYFVHANQKIMHNKLLSCGIQLQIKMTHNKLVEQSTRRKIYCLYLIFKLILAFELLALNQDFTFWNRLDICPVEINNIHPRIKYIR